MKQESRRYPRFEVDREARVERFSDDGADPADAAVGRASNVSASGVSVAGLDHDMALAEDDAVGVSVVGMQPRNGRVVRVIEDAVAIDFGLDEEDEHEAIAELGIITGELNSLLDG